MTNEDLNQIQSLVSSAQRVLILTHKDPSIDAMAAALAIYLSLLKMGKDVTVAMESLPLVEVGNLVGVNNVKTTLAGKNLLLTYQPYTLGDFEHVTYLEDQTHGDAFKMTITPREGFVPNPSNFKFTTVGGSADLIFTIDVLEPSQLGALNDSNLLGACPIINIDNHDPNKDYGKFNLVEPDAASLSEIATFFLRAINGQIDTDIASNLYQGIVQATNHFQSERVAAATLEAAAICLRAGAKAISQVPKRQDPISTPEPPLNNSQGNVPADWSQPKAYRGTSVI